MKALLLCIFLPFLSSINSIDWKDVMNDFGKKLNNKRFSKKVVLVREDFQDKIFDTTTITSANLKKVAWSAINSVMAKCDYIATKDSSSFNCFFIYSDKGYKKFWVKYDGDNKIAIIKIIKPKISVHLVPPPCGY